MSMPRRRLTPPLPAKVEPLGEGVAVPHLAGTPPGSGGRCGDRNGHPGETPRLERLAPRLGGVTIDCAVVGENDAEHPQRGVSRVEPAADVSRNQFGIAFDGDAVSAAAARDTGPRLTRF